MGYIVFGIIIAIFIYITALYFINGKKIKAKEAKKLADEKKKDDLLKDVPVKAKSIETGKQKVELKAEIVKSPVEDAKKEIDEREHLKAEFANVQTELSHEKEMQGHRLTIDRSSFKTELDGNKTAIEKSRLAKGEVLESDRMESKTISSQTNQIGTEGPNKKQMTELEEALASQKENGTDSNNISSQIENLSPELKAILLSTDILNKKY